MTAEQLMRRHNLVDAATKEMSAIRRMYKEKARLSDLQLDVQRRKREVQAAVRQSQQMLSAAMEDMIHKMRTVKKQIEAEERSQLGMWEALEREIAGSSNELNTRIRSCDRALTDGMHHARQRSERNRRKQTLHAAKDAYHGSAALAKSWNSTKRTEAPVFSARVASTLLTTWDGCLPPMPRGVVARIVSAKQLGDLRRSRAHLSLLIPLVGGAQQPRATWTPCLRLAPWPSTPRRRWRTIWGAGGRCGRRPRRRRRPAST